MPYIPYLNRQVVKEQAYIGAQNSLIAGELNYVITDLLVRWLGYNPSYSDFNTAIGVLECAKLELYRKMVAPYEDKKCDTNGEVYITEGY